MSAQWAIDERELRFWGRDKGAYNLNAIALLLDVAPSTLSRVINGKSEPGQVLLASIRATFGPEPAYS